MTADAAQPDQIEQEAAEWFARLNRLSISTQALEEFQAWRQDPLHDAAYERIEALWSAAGRLREHPDTARDVAAALARGARRQRWSRSAKIAAGVLVLAATGALTLGIAFERGRPLTTGVGEQRLVSLDDGTKVRLDTDTRLRVRLTGDARQIVLERGQAFFDVAHDASRPFVVRAGDQSVRALGTRFEVRREGEVVRVTLVEGAVEVKGEDQARRLAPGEALAARAGALEAPRRVDLAAATSWTSGRLVFRSTPLAQAVAEVNRYSDGKVVLDTPQLKNVPVSGVFDVGDTRAFVAAVSDLFALEAQQEGAGYRLKARS